MNKNSEEEFNRIFETVAQKLLAEGKIELVSGKGAKAVCRKVQHPKADIQSFSA